MCPKVVKLGPKFKDRKSKIHTIFRPSPKKQHPIHYKEEFCEQAVLISFLHRGKFHGASVNFTIPFFLKLDVYVLLTLYRNPI